MTSPQGSHKPEYGPAQAATLTQLARLPTPWPSSR
ncbi:hypothetical protein LINGRAHAP2_LOCUS24867 [Linum grandiflorum]